MSVDFLYSLLALSLPCLPLLVIICLFIQETRRLSLTLAPFLPLFALPLFFLHGQTVDLPWLLLGARVGLDNLSTPLLLLGIIAWTVAGWHARLSIPKARQTNFFLFWLLTWTGNLCVFLTLDAASFYAAYAMMTFSAYGLVIFHRRPEDYRAGRVYLTMAVLGEAFIISGLLLTAREFGNPLLDWGSPGIEELSRSTLASWLFMVGFAVKMGLIPLHMWLPLAHPQAPVPASAVLSGVILKAGLIGCLRFLPLTEPGFETVGLTLLAAGLASAFLGVLLGLTQGKIKSLLAYSSVSQMGLIAAALGAAMLKPEASTSLIMVAVLLAVHHGLAKTALFLSVDMMKLRPQAAWWFSCLPALALAGAPFTSGALAKVSLKAAWPEELALLEWALLSASLATALLMGRFLYLGAQALSSSAEEGSSINHWLILLAAGLLLPWGIAALLGLSLSQPFQFSYLFESALPVLLAAVLGLLAWRFWPRGASPDIPPGDLLNLISRLPFKGPMPVTLKVPTLPRLRIGPSQIKRQQLWFADPGIAGLLALLVLLLLWLLSAL